MVEEKKGFLKYISQQSGKLGVTASIILATVAADCGDIGESPVTQFPSKIQEYFPEVVVAGARLESTEHLSTVIPTSIYNFTNARLDPEVLNYIYQYYEGLTVSGEVPYAKDYLMGSTAYDLAIALRTNIKERNIFLIPTNVAHPAWAIQAGMGRSRAATGIMSDDTTMTFIYSLPTDGSVAKQTVQLAQTFAFATEACQSVIRVKTYDMQGNLAVESLKKTAGQEIVCNSDGFALTNGLISTDYKTFRLTVDSTPVFQTYSTIPVSESQYRGIKPLGAVIK